MENAALHSSAYDGQPGRIEVAGVDWITATATDPARQPELAKLARAILDGQKRAGNDLRPWPWNGYRGARSVGVEAGSRADSVIVRLSGECASFWWLDVFRVAQRCSRLDVQVTVAGIPAGVDLAGWSTPQVDIAPPRRGRPTDWTYVQSRRRGATLYLGARTSERYYRLYDKCAEQGEQHLGGRWRYECEAKGATALTLATWLAGARSLKGRCVDLIHYDFLDRGVRPAFRAHDRPELRTAPADRSDDERRIRWLAEHVRRTTDGLISRGRLRDVILALGLAGEESTTRAE